MDSRPDEVLVAATVAGDPDAFAVLLRRYRDVHARYVIRMLGSRDDAEDVLQQVFVRAYRGLRSCRNPERFGAWLYQIVINETRTFASRRARRQRWYTADEVDLDRLIATSSTSEEFGYTEEIQRALQQLVPEQREAFLLKYVEELSYEEMSAVTGASISALKMRVSRACERLRALLEGVVHVH